MGSTGTLVQCKLLNSSTGGVFLGQVTAHHFDVGIVFITSSVIGIRYHSIGEKIPKTTAPLINSWHAQLSMNLAIAGSLSIAFAHAMYAIPIYPYCASDYPTVLCLFTHQRIISLLIKSNNKRSCGHGIWDGSIPESNKRLGGTEM